MWIADNNVRHIHTQQKNLLIAANSWLQKQGGSRFLQFLIVDLHTQQLLGHWLVHGIYLYLWKVI